MIAAARGTAIWSLALALALAVAACDPNVPDIAPTAAQASDTSIVTRALDAANDQWRRVETARTILFVSPALPENATVGIADSVEVVIDAHLAWLGAADIGPKLRLFFVNSRDDMQRLTGLRAPGLAEPGSGAAVFALGDTAPMGLRHEMMHVLSWRHWGMPSSFWLSEAIAVNSVPSCGGLPTSDVIAMLGRADMFIPLETLRTNFTFACDSGFVFYLQAAGLARYIDTTYGRERLKAVWSRGGLANVRETLGIDLATLERDWRAAVAAAPASMAWPGWPLWNAQLNKHGCS